MSAWCHREYSTFSKNETCLDRSAFYANEDLTFLSRNTIFALLVVIVTIKSLWNILVDLIDKFLVYANL